MPEPVARPGAPYAAAALQTPERGCAVAPRPVLDQEDRLVNTEPFWNLRSSGTRSRRECLGLFLVGPAGTVTADSWLQVSPAPPRLPRALGAHPGTAHPEAPCPLPFHLGTGGKNAGLQPCPPCLLREPQGLLLRGLGFHICTVRVDQIVPGFPSVVTSMSSSPSPSSLARPLLQAVLAQGVTLFHSVTPGTPCPSDLGSCPCCGKGGRGSPPPRPPASSPGAQVSHAVLPHGPPGPLTPGRPLPSRRAWWWWCFYCLVLYLSLRPSVWNLP